VTPPAVFQSESFAEVKARAQSTGRWLIVDATAQYHVGWFELRDGEDATKPEGLGRGNGGGGDTAVAGSGDRGGAGR
jgi:hypothetical protein